MEGVSKLEVELIEKEINPIIKKAETIVIQNVDDVEEASTFLRKLKDAEIIVEDKRLEFTKPLNQSLKNINETFKEMKEPLIKARGILSAKILDWKAAEKRRRDDEEERVRKLIEEKTQLEEDEVEEVIAATVPKIENTIGNVKAVKRWVFEITDFSKVPDMYKTLNIVAVNGAIRAGARDIPGLEITQKESLSIV